MWWPGSGRQMCRCPHRTSDMATSHTGLARPESRSPTHSADLTPCFLSPVRSGNSTDIEAGQPGLTARLGEVDSAVRLNVRSATPTQQ